LIRGSYIDQVLKLGALYPQRERETELFSSEFVVIDSGRVYSYSCCDDRMMAEELGEGGAL
jgi:hypothetical protein